MHISDSLRLNALRHPHKTAIICGQRRISYRELNRRVNRLANGFSGLGYTPDEKVAILLYNCAEYLECFAGLTKAGLIPVPISHLLNDAEIQAILANSDSVAAVVDGDFLDRIMAMPQKMRHVVTVNGPVGSSGLLDYESLLTAAAASEPADPGRNSSTIMIHSSGTTGLPKGIVRSRYGLAERAIQQGFLPDHRMLCVMPPFFSMGEACDLLSLYLGETMVFVRRFDPEENLRIIVKEKINATAWVVTMLKDVVEAARGGTYDLGSLKLILISGQLSEKRKAEAFETFGPVLQTYFGSSETGPSNFMGSGDLLDRNETNCVGKVFFGNEVVLLDESNHEVPTGQIGRICCKGPATYDCYYKDPAATAQTVCGGYVTVGDLGRFDEQGYLYFEGRSQDMIKSGGMNIYAQEVENQLCKHPQIKEAAVIGVPDERWGEAVKAIVSLKEGSGLSKEDIIAFSKKSLSSHKTPKSIEIVTELPKNLMGKVLKAELKKKFVS